VSNDLAFNFRAGHLLPMQTPTQVSLLDQDAKRVAAALRAGGFACLFSETIQPTGGAMSEKVAGFPGRIHFVALPAEQTDDPSRAFAISTYWADPKTCRDGDDGITMRYESEWVSEFSVEVTRCKDKPLWKGTKYRGDTAVLWATGQDLRRFLIQLACGRVHNGEVVLHLPEEFDLRGRMGVLGVYTFTPTPESGNLLQLADPGASPDSAQEEKTEKLTAETNAHQTSPEPDSRRRTIGSQLETNPLEDLQVVSLDPNYCIEEQWERFQTLDIQIEDMFEVRHYAEARALVESMIKGLSDVWKPLEESDDCLIRAFWYKSDAVAFQRAHPKGSKQLLWGVPSLSKLYYLQSCTYSRELRFDVAHDCLRKGFECEPDHPQLWHGEATLLLWEKRFEEALEAYRTAATIRSWTAPSLLARCMYGQGLTLESLQRLTEARDAFARALEFDPVDSRAKRKLACLNYDLRRLQAREGNAAGPSDWTEMPGCFSLVKNIAPPDALPLPVPNGLTRCPACGEYRGLMALKDTQGFNPNSGYSPDTPLRIQCICDGVRCPRCKTNRYHRPATNLWDERAGFQRVPEWRGLFACDGCDAEREERTAEERRLKMERRRKMDESNPNCAQPGREEPR
jgi:tetratricopeptide (TPR) repeat protein